MIRKRTSFLLFRQALVNIIVAHTIFEPFV